jgi:superfamily II DNA or RNA helicase
MPKFTLMKHQKQGVLFLHKNDGVGALLYDPGVGKTGTVLSWVDRLARSTPNREVRVLVVAPLTATDTWVLQVPDFMDSVVKSRVLMGRTDSILAQMRKARQWTAVPDSKISLNHPGVRSTQVGGNRVTILSLSAGALSSYCGTPTHRVAMLRAVRAFAPDLIVMDESHMIKAPTSTISVAMYQLAPLAKHRIILTGTVNPHSPLDVYGQWRFLAPWTFSDQHGEDYTKRPTKMTVDEWKEIKPWSWDSFQKHYSTPGGYKGKGIGGFQNLPELNNRVAERSHVVLKKDALDLPPVQDVDVHVSLNTAEAKAYQQMCDDLATELASGEVIEAVNVLAKLMKLRQITSGFAKDTETGEVHNIGSSKRKDVMEVCNVTLAGEKRLVVFAYFRAECEMLADALRKTNKGATVEVITGATHRNERLAIRQRFGDVSGNPQRMILVAQARTMSISVNELVTAQHGVFASLSERRDDWVQARGRLDRKGQVGKSVTFWNCFVPGTIDEIMIQRHKDRGDLEKDLLDHIRRVAAAPKGKWL